jgi:hypothetical protein
MLCFCRLRNHVARYMSNNLQKIITVSSSVGAEIFQTCVISTPKDGERLGEPYHSLNRSKVKGSHKNLENNYVKKPMPLPAEHALS